MTKLVGVRLSSEEQDTLKAALGIIQAMYKETGDAELQRILSSARNLDCILMNGGIWTYERNED